MSTTGIVLVLGLAILLVVLLGCVLFVRRKAGRRGFKAAERERAVPGDSDRLRPAAPDADQATAATADEIAPADRNTGADSAAPVLDPRDQEELEDLERRVLEELSEAEHDDLFHALLDRIKRSVPIRAVSTDALHHSIALRFADGLIVLIDSRDQRLALRLLSLSQRHQARLHWAEWRPHGVALGLAFGRVEIEVIAIAEV